MLCRFLQLNDGEMAAAGHVSDAEVEALAASAPDRSQRDGVEDSGPDALIPLLGKRKDGARCPARHGNLRRELSDVWCQAVR